MADGRTHDQLTSSFTVLLPVAVAGFYYNTSPDKLPQVVGLAFLACQLQRIYSPDVDVDSGYYGLHIANIMLGNVLGYIWEILIWPLRWFRHRSIWTHGIFIGSLIRLAYLYLLYFIFSLPVPHLFIPVTLHNLEYVLIFYIVFSFCDFGHWILDFVWRW